MGYDWIRGATRTDLSFAVPVHVRNGSAAEQLKWQYLPCGYSLSNGLKFSVGGFMTTSLILLSLFFSASGVRAAESCDELGANHSKLEAFVSDKMEEIASKRKKLILKSSDEILNVKLRAGSDAEKQKKQVESVNTPIVAEISQIKLAIGDAKERQKSVWLKMAKAKCANLFEIVANGAFTTDPSCSKQASAGVEDDALTVWVNDKATAPAK